MYYHGELMIYYLLYLYVKMTNQNEIELETLEAAFYELEMSVNESNNCKQSLDFESVLETILTKYSHLFDSFGSTLSFAYDKYDEIERILLESIEGLTLIDTNMESCIYEPNIYYALELPLPTEELKDLFNICATLPYFFKLLAHQELNNKPQNVTIKALTNLIKYIKERVLKCDNCESVKIDQCLSYYDSKFLSSKTIPNINSSWYILLLSKSKKAQNVLNYDIISTLYSGMPESDEEEQDEEEITSSDLPDACYYIEEIPVFFTIYLLYLHEYIKRITNPELKEILTNIKYSMFSLGDLLETTEEFLKVGSLDDLDLPLIKESFLTKHHFSFIGNSFDTILSNIIKKDSEISVSTEKDIIINLLLLKCFLDLSINEGIKIELQRLLSNPEFYKNPEYSYVTSKIDEIIFNGIFLEQKRRG